MKPETCPYPFLKWLTDRTLSLGMLVLLAPLLVMILLGMALSMLLRSCDRGPFLYREPRISRGREFHVLKFRVLRREVLARIEGKGDHARIHEADPSNLTWAGRYLLKKWYLDELPQLLNILRGDMSLVGPRPWPVHMVHDQVRRGLDYRNLIHAGWTGPSQLQKGSAAPRNSEELDLAYLHLCRNSSGLTLWRYDMKALYRTARLIVEGKGLLY